MLRWIGEFDPDDVKDYTANWTLEMDARSDTIDTTTFDVDSDTTGVAVASSAVDVTAKKAVVWFTSADKAKSRLFAGTTIPIAHSVTTVGGRLLNKTIGLKIKEL